jgi:cell division protein FtsZ
MTFPDARDELERSNLQDIDNAIRSILAMRRKGRAVSAKITKGSADSFYLVAVGLVLGSGLASSSFLARRMGIGYLQAVRLLERMQADGIVSCADAVGKRCVLAPWTVPEFDSENGGQAGTRKEETSSIGVEGKEDAPDSEPNALCMAPIKVIGIGAAGGAVIESMAKKRSQDYELIAAGADSRPLDAPRADNAIALNQPLLARKAKSIRDAKILFVIADVNGEREANDAVAIADIARSQGILTVAIVAHPHELADDESGYRVRDCFENLKDRADCVIVVPGAGSSSVAQNDFEVLAESVCTGIASIILTPGIISVDLEDLKAVMGRRGLAAMGWASTSDRDPDRTERMVQEAISGPLAMRSSLSKASGLLIHLAVSPRDMNASEVRRVIASLSDCVSPEADVFLGLCYDEDMREGIRLTFVATQVEGQK